MLKSGFFALLFLFLSCGLQAQSFDLNWSDQFQYDNAKDGFFSEFIDVNSKYLYARYNNLAFSEKKANRKIRLVAFDKVTMKQVASRAIKGFKENAKNKKKYSTLDYMKTVVFEESVFVFWYEKKGDNESIYVETFSADKLKQLEKIKKIYSVTINDDKPRRARSIFVLSNETIDGKFIIGAEKTQRDERVELKYVTLSMDLSITAESTVELPVKPVGKFTGSATQYEMGNDGNIYARSAVTMSKEDKKKLPKGTASSYSILSIIDTETGEIEPFVMKYDDKNIFNFGYKVDDNGIVKLYGFFCDLKKDPKGFRTHGIFYAILDSKVMDTKDVHFSYFDKQTLDELFKDDKGDKSNTAGGLKSRKKKAALREQDEESLNGLYEIEKVISVENEEIVLFCSIMHNYTVRTCTSSPNGGQTCTTNYYCNKRNVTAFKLDKNGDIVWASNINRGITYSGWFVYDLQVAYKNDKFYAIYGQTRILTKAERKKEKKSPDSKFEYGIFENKTGEQYVETFTVTNSSEVKKKERKKISPTSLSVFENNFYANSQTQSYKPATIGVCVGSVVCWPAVIFINHPNLRKGIGYLGKLEPIE